MWKTLASAESASKKDAKRCRYIFYSSSGSGDIREKQNVEKQGDVFFCYSLYVSKKPTKWANQKIISLGGTIGCAWVIELSFTPFFYFINDNFRKASSIFGHFE